MARTYSRTMSVISADTMIVSLSKGIGIRKLFVSGSKHVIFHVMSSGRLDLPLCRRIDCEMLIQKTYPATPALHTPVGYSPGTKASKRKDLIDHSKGSSSLPGSAFPRVTLVTIV